MEDKLKINIDGKDFLAEKGDYVLPFALKNEIDIPRFCYIEDKPINASCRLCLVEVVDEKRGNWITSSCTLAIKDGMKILTNSEQVRELRKEVLEFLFAGHKAKCKAKDCKICKLIDEYGADTEKYNRK